MAEVAALAAFFSACFDPPSLRRDTRLAVKAASAAEAPAARMSATSGLSSKPISASAAVFEGSAARTRRGLAARFGFADFLGRLAAVVLRALPTFRVERAGFFVTVFAI